MSALTAASSKLTITRPPRLMEVSGLTKSYGGQQVLADISFLVFPGEILGLIGPNGAGKTTFMNAVSSFVPLTGGRVIVDGIDATGWSPQRLVAAGLVRTFQDVATFPGLTVFENVELGALGAGLSRRGARNSGRRRRSRPRLSRTAMSAASALLGRSQSGRSSSSSMSPRQG
jgi:branched-chain amino acid transport system ATP-binding protein